MTCMDQKVRSIVKEYIDQHLDATDIQAQDGVGFYSVFTVWKCKILHNWKYLISSTLLDGMYYEVTYNGDRKEWYLDAYKKVDNRVIDDHDEAITL